MGQVPAKTFPSPVSFGNAPLNGVLQAKMTPQAPQMQFPSLNVPDTSKAPANPTATAQQGLLGTLKPPMKPGVPGGAMPGGFRGY